MKKNEIIAQLLKNGGTQINGLKVRSITITPKEDYTRLGLTVDQDIKGMISDDGVTYKEGTTNVIFSSIFSISSLFKDDDDLAFVANYIVDHPDTLSVLLSRAKINIIQEPVVKGQAYQNPWSKSNKSIVFDHDTFIDHIINISLSDRGLAGLDKIADKMLGI